jgi:hypothetical protein
MFDRAPCIVTDCLSIIPPSAAVDEVPCSMPLMRRGSASADCTSPAEIIFTISPVVTWYDEARIFSALGTPPCSNWFMLPMSRVPLAIV